MNFSTCNVRTQRHTNSATSTMSNVSATRNVQDFMNVGYVVVHGKRRKCKVHSSRQSNSLYLSGSAQCFLNGQRFDIREHIVQKRPFIHHW